MSVSAPSLSAPQAAFSDRRKAFRALHERGCFHSEFLGCGFGAVPSTPGIPGSGDGGVLARERNLAYIGSMTAAVDLPVSADVMSGYVPAS
jgi:hypothetical protein